MTQKKFLNPAPWSIPRAQTLNSLILSVAACLALSVGACGAPDSRDAPESFTPPPAECDVAVEGIACGVLLDGKPEALAAEQVRDVSVRAPIGTDERADDESGRELILSRLHLALSRDTTVQAVNDLLNQHDARIVSSLQGSRWVVMAFPKEESVVRLGELAAELEQTPVIDAAVVVITPAPQALPSNHTPSPDVPTLQHHLAVRAHAAWNAASAMSPRDKRPVVVVYDHFGKDGRPSPARFAIEFPASDFHPEVSGSDWHGYHVTGIIAGKHGPQADTTSLGRISGFFPGELDGRAVDVLGPGSKPELENEVLQIIRTARNAGRNVILNTSIGNPCPVAAADPEDQCTKEDYLDDVADGKTVPHYILTAGSWIERVVGKGLHDQFLHVTAAGNDAIPTIVVGPYSTAALAGGVCIPDDDTLPEGDDGCGGDVNVLDNLENIIVVENRQVDSSTPPIRPGCLWDGGVDNHVPSNFGGHLSAIGHDVWSMESAASSADRNTGTSMAAPEVTGLAAFLWSLDPELELRDIIAILKTTAVDANCPGGDNGSPAIDAYAATLAVDCPPGASGGSCSLGEAEVRRAILDVNDDSVFEAEDLIEFVEAFEAAKDAGYPFDYSRWDLNGDGRTGNDETAAFNLDVGDPRKFDVITQSIEGEPEPFDETASSDIDILCYYAYSPLYDDSNDPDGCKRNELLNGICHCEPPPSACPSQKSEGAVDDICLVEDCTNYMDDDSDDKADCDDPDCAGHESCRVYERCDSNQDEDGDGDVDCDDEDCAYFPGCPSCGDDCPPYNDNWGWGLSGVPCEYIGFATVPPAPYGDYFCCWCGEGTEGSVWTRFSCTVGGYLGGIPKCGRPWY